MRHFPKRWSVCIGVTVLSVGALGTFLGVRIATASAEASAVEAARERDRDVLETVLSEKLDPNNPDNRAFITNRGRPGKELVLDRYTLRLEGSQHLAVLEALDSKAAIPAGVSGDLQRRNAGGTFALQVLSIKAQSIIFDDIDALAQGAWRHWEAQVASGRKVVSPDFVFADAFWAKHADSWGFVTVCLPGYSADGTSAVVVLNAGPSPHGLAEVYLLARAEAAWRVSSRWQEAFR